MIVRAGYPVEPTEPTVELSEVERECAPVARAGNVIALVTPSNLVDAHHAIESRLQEIAVLVDKMESCSRACDSTALTGRLRELRQSLRAPHRNLSAMAEEVRYIADSEVES